MSTEQEKLEEAFQRAIASFRPIAIVKVARGYNVYVNKTPLVPADEGPGYTLDRLKAGVKVDKKKFTPPKHTSPFLFPTKDRAKGAAHTIGRYLFNLGDFTYSYTALIGVSGDHEKWWNR